MIQGNVRKGILLILITLSSLFLVSTGLLNVRSVAAASRSATVIHDGIAIHSEEEFTSANGVVSGSGTPADPYVIENWDIEVPAYSVPVVFPGGTYLAGILIANTTAHVVLRNVQVHSGFPEWGVNLGIVLWNTTNVAVESSRVWNGNHGVLMLGAKDSRIVLNEFYNLIEAVAIAGGVPSNAFVATGNVISQNTIHDARAVGIEVLNSSRNMIRNNSISRSLWGALFESGSIGNVFSMNRIINSTVGVEALYSSYNNTISGNFFDVKIEGIGIGFGSNGTLVRSNEVHSLQWGINLIEVSGSEVSRNHVQASDVGINLLRAATMNIITGNVVASHTGIFVCRTSIGSNSLAPPPNDLRASDRPIEHCH